MYFLALLPLIPAADPQPKIDLVIRNATIHDGSGAAGKKGDIAIGGDRIIAVGTFEIPGKPRIVDGSGLIVAPGFIDLHTHCDGGNSVTSEQGRPNRCYLMQGVTTVVTGNCGSGPTNVEIFFDRLEKSGVGTNVIHQVPHNSVRASVMGNVNRAPTEEELAKMVKLVDAQMKDGCWGLSTGLIYTPGTYSKTDEIIALAKVAAKHKGFYASHIRNEGVGLLTAVEEAIQIGKEAKIPVHISHIKCSGKASWGSAGNAIALIKKARADGQIVTADQYPYIASSTSLAATLIPTRFRDGTPQEYKARLRDPESVAKIRKAIEDALAEEGRAKSIQIARCESAPKRQGKSLAVVAEEEKKSVVDLVIEIELKDGAQVVNFGMREEDVRLYMKETFTATASDGSSQVPGTTVPHPRSYGTFPRKIGRYAIDDGIISLEQAIRSSSGLPADILQLKDRGYLKAGYYADVVVFDPKTFRDTATFEKPHQYAEGVKYLFVNGQLVIDEGKYRNVLAGKPLRHSSK